VYVNPGFTVRLEGLPEAESAALLEQVFAHCLDERFRLRYRWSPGDVVIWDNAAVMHCATARELPPGARRTLWRTVIGGLPPN
jgi:taurine dioxygenase